MVTKLSEAIDKRVAAEEVFRREDRTEREKWRKLVERLAVGEQLERHRRDRFYQLIIVLLVIGLLAVIGVGPDKLRELLPWIGGR